MDELKSCPFCGSDAALADKQDGVYVFYYVVCTKCQGKCGGYPNKQVVIDNWNMRPNG
jgi:Lar family restriction alleviation protein